MSDQPLTLTTPDSLASDVNEALSRLIDNRIRLSLSGSIYAVVQDAVLSATAAHRKRLEVLEDRCFQLESCVVTLDEQRRILEGQLRALDAEPRGPDPEEVRAEVRSMIRDGELVVTLDYV